MTEMQAEEARERIEEMLMRAEAGETVLITRDGRTIARLEPEKPPRRQLNELDRERAATLKDSFAQVDDFRRSAGNWATVDEILAWRHEGHKY